MGRRICGTPMHVSTCQPGQTMSLTQRQLACKQPPAGFTTTLRRPADLNSPLPLTFRLGILQSARARSERKIAVKLILAQNIPQRQFTQEKNTQKLILAHFH
jgi:hypothetical protein